MDGHNRDIRYSKRMFRNLKWVFHVVFLNRTFHVFFFLQWEKQYKYHLKLNSHLKCCNYRIKYSTFFGGKLCKQFFKLKSHRNNSFHSCKMSSALTEFSTRK